MYVSLNLHLISPPLGICTCLLYVCLSVCFANRFICTNFLRWALGIHCQAFLPPAASLPVSSCSALPALSLNALQFHRKLDMGRVFSIRFLPNHSSRKTDTLLPTVNVCLLCPLLVVGLGGGPSFSGLPALGVHVRAILFQISLLSGSAWEGYLSF